MFSVCLWNFSIFLPWFLTSQPPLMAVMFWEQAVCKSMSWTLEGSVIGFIPASLVAGHILKEPWSDMSMGDFQLSLPIAPMTVMVISFILTILPVVGITQHFPACLVTTNTCRLPVWSKQSGHPPSLPDARYTNTHLGLLEMQDPMLEDVIQLAKVSQPGCKVVLMCVALCKQNTDRNERSMLASVMCFW